MSESEHWFNSVCRISSEEYIAETNSDERSSIASCLSKAVIYFLEREIPVYLEGLGILVPLVKSKKVNAVYEGKTVLRTEKYRTIKFEKCSDISSYHRDAYPKLIEINELAQKIHPNLPLAINLKWQVPAIRRLLRALIVGLRNEIILSGYSNALEELGEFLSLHNRQGKELSDWFAGADIFLKPRYREVLLLGEPLILETPIVRDAWEPMEAAFGQAVACVDIDLKNELKSLGYSLDANDKTLSLKIFERKSGTDKILTYVSDGLRLESTADYGTELIFQILADRPEEEPVDSAGIPIWPLRAISIGWILLQSAPNKKLKAGVGMSCGAALCDFVKTDLNSIITTEYSYVPNLLQTETEKFKYINIVGISSLESDVAKNNSAAYLLDLLRYKELDQITRLRRYSSIASKKIVFDMDNPGQSLSHRAANG